MQGHIVAILRSDLAPEQRAERLVRILAVTPYEARQHASAALPRALVPRPTAEDAQQLADLLGAEGMTASVFHPTDLLSDTRRFLARTLQVQDAGIAAARKDGARMQLAWGDIAAVLVGVRKTLAFVDVIDARGGALCARERDTQFEGSGLPHTGGRAAVLALAQLVRSRSNGRFDDRLMKPATLMQVCGPFASSPIADDLAETVLLRSLLS